MGNFLTNLAKRSFTAAGGMRPHRASLFEPAGFEPASSVSGTIHDSGENTSLETISFSDAEVTAAAPGEAARGSSAKIPVGRKSSGNADVSSPEEKFQDISEDRPKQQSSLPVPSQRKALPARSSQNIEIAQENVRPVAAPGIQPTVIMPSPIESLLAPVPTMPGSGDQRSLRKESSALASPVAPVMPEMPLKEHRNRRSGQDAVSLSHIADRSLTVAQPVAPLARGRTQSKRTFGPPQQEPEPSIHVTIGRVEVRAEVSGQAPRRAERTSSPVMSLEEYLQRRAKRGGE